MDLKYIRIDAPNGMGVKTVSHCINWLFWIINPSPRSLSISFFFMKSLEFKLFAVCVYRQPNDKCVENAREKFQQKKVTYSVDFFVGFCWNIVSLTIRLKWWIRFCRTISKSLLNCSLKSPPFAGTHLVQFQKFQTSKCRKILFSFLSFWFNF